MENPWIYVNIWLGTVAICVCAWLAAKRFDGSIRFMDSAFRDELISLQVRFESLRQSVEKLAENSVKLATGAQDLAKGQDSTKTIVGGHVINLRAFTSAIAEIRNDASKLAEDFNDLVEVRRGDEAPPRLPERRTRNIQVSRGREDEDEDRSEEPLDQSVASPAAEADEPAVRDQS